VRKILKRVKGGRNILRTVNRRKANRIGHILGRNCLIKHVIEGKMGRRGGGLKQLMDDFKETKR
jgi:hypothetical protein